MFALFFFSPTNFSSHATHTCLVCNFDLQSTRWDVEKIGTPTLQRQPSGGAMEVLEKTQRKVRQASALLVVQ